MTRASKSWRPQYARGYVMEISSSLDTFPPHSRLPFALLLALSLSFSLSSPSPPFFPHSLSLGAPSSLFLTSTSSIDSHLSVPFRNGLFPSFFFFFLFRNDFFFLSFFTNRVPTGNGSVNRVCFPRVSIFREFNYHVNGDGRHRFSIDPRCFERNVLASDKSFLLQTRRKTRNGNRISEGKGGFSEAELMIRFGLTVADK